MAAYSLNPQLTKMKAPTCGLASRPQIRNTPPVCNTVVPQLAGNDRRMSKLPQLTSPAFLTDEPQNRNHAIFFYRIFLR